MKCSFLYQSFSKLRTVVWLHQTFKEKMSFYQIMLVLLKELIYGARAQGLKPKNMSTELWGMIDSQKSPLQSTFCSCGWGECDFWGCWVMRIMTMAIGLLMEIMNCLWWWWGGPGQELQAWLTITINYASTTTSTMTATCAYPLLLLRKVRIPINNPITAVMTPRTITPQPPIPQSTVSLQPLPQNINY